MVAIGTWRWVEETNGMLTSRHRLAIMAEAALLRAKSRFGARRRETIRHIEVDKIIPPDSALCKAAEALCAEASPPFLFNHSIRAYFWARLLNDHPIFDDEALYVAVLLHDLGLTERHRAALDKAQCFTLPAARAATGLALMHGWPERRARLVGDAICLHINVVVGKRHGREAQLVRLGSGADVAGFGLERLAPDQRDEVVRRYPRLNMKCEISDLLETETEDCPCSRIAFLYRKLQFGKMIRRTPIFAE
ncbi:MAG: HD domain-containing protein [Beijerinckiaceae bacterium]|nr:HD domain-containing protein [Beijerinckiaceae bacterium]